MLSGVETEKLLTLPEFADGKPSSIDASELPEVALLFEPLADVNSWSK